MEFDFDDDQYAFADSVRVLLRQVLPPETLRGLWDDGSGVRALWERLAETGLLGVTADEEHGGGGTPIDLALPFEALGAAGAPDAFALTAGVVVPILSRYAPADLVAAELPGLVDGTTLAAVVDAPQSLVLGAQDADVFLVITDERVTLLPRAEAEVTPRATQDPMLRAGVVAATGTAAAVSDDPVVVARARAATRAVLASTLIGNAQRQIELTRDYTLAREQFGRSIATFQAVKHRLATAFVQVEAARSLAWWAHYALAAEPDAVSTASSMAKSSANAAADLAGSAALQLHGGIGFTWEYDLHLWLQRSASLQRLHGRTQDLRLTVGDGFLEEYGVPA